MRERIRESDKRRLGDALHDLCQPVTTLQCGLEMAEIAGTPEAYREAVRQGLVDCARLFTLVGEMRHLLRRAGAPRDDGIQRVEDGR
jgi:signal transduction histidine kinase